MSGMMKLAVIACTAFLLALPLDLRADNTVEDLIDQASQAGERGKHEEAVRLASEAIGKDATAATAYYVRGRENFRLGRMRESVADFDKYVELQPNASARQWERGIACFYAGLHEQGAKQFESYQKFDGHDVENSVWRYLCLVPQVGVQRAQATMLPIENDRRIPMMQIYDLYRGQLGPDAVLATIRADGPSPDVLAGRLFYANLYLGLWHESLGEKDKAKPMIEAAAKEDLKDNRHINRYMWDVARIHHQLRMKKSEK
jgi:lipoprotein NlpI